MTKQKIDISKVISDIIWAIVHLISKPPLNFLGLITGFCIIFEVHAPDYYYRYVDKKWMTNFFNVIVWQETLGDKAVQPFHLQHHNKTDMSL